MHPGQNFYELPAPERMASHILTLLRNGRPQAAVPWACAGANRTSGASFFELNALAAVALERAGSAELALEYWDRLIRSAPHRFKWLEAGLQAAWRLESENAREYADKWTGLLERVYIDTPSPGLLAALIARGWRGHGCVGLHEGYLKGWLWLAAGDRPAMKTDLAGGKFSMELKPAGKTATHTLYKIRARLPQTNSPFNIVITTVASGHLQGSPVCGSPAAMIRAGKGKKGDLVTVLVPVYGDREATLACLGALFASLRKNRARTDILVAWDDGPDQKLYFCLQKLAARGKIRLIENPRNMGFLASVNHALAEIKNGDVILLNADTIVHGDWIDRLVLAAAPPDTATVTALGNEAELMSFPSVSDRAKIRGLRDVRLYDQAASALDPERARLEIPVGVGFCMLITRRALDAIGGLDGVNLFRGYGEEVDFCLRAAKRGLRNYGAFNVFVGHLGERSFGLGKKALAAQNNEAICKIFTTYRRAYEMFTQEQKPRQLREEISLRLLASVEKPERLELRPWSARYLPPWLKDEQTDFGRNGAVLFVRPGVKPLALLRVAQDLALADIHFDIPDDCGRLEAALAALGNPDAVATGCREGHLELASKLGVTVTRCEQGSGDEPVLPDACYAEKRICALPPASLRGWKKLERIAAAHPGAVFYVLYVDALWGGAPRPANILELPRMTDYRPLNLELVLLAEPNANIEAWQDWLIAHGCPSLPVFRMDGDD